MTVVILGDSIAAGMGVAGRSYADLLRSQSAGRFDVDNRAGTGRMISSSLDEIADVIARRPARVVIAHGVFESIYVPNAAAMRWVPRRWRGKGGLDPRPYSSRRFFRRFFQQALSAFRWRYKVFLIRHIGGECWMPPSDFAAQLRQMVAVVLQDTEAKIVLLTPPAIDAKCFPGSPILLEANRQMMLQTCHDYAEIRRVAVCDVSKLLNEWNDFFDDHFHPNAAGHEKIAIALIESIGGENQSVFQYHDRSDDKSSVRRH